MKRLIQGLAVIGLGMPLLSAGLVQAQTPENLPESLPENLPVLEQPTATSATLLDELQTRKASSDFDFIFLPTGAGGEEQANSAADWSYATELNPNQAMDDMATRKLLPAYTVVQPDRSLETQTDPQRLTVLTPFSRTVTPR